MPDPVAGKGGYGPVAAGVTDAEEPLQRHAEKRLASGTGQLLRYLSGSRSQQRHQADRQQHGQDRAAEDVAEHPCGERDQNVGLQERLEVGLPRCHAEAPPSHTNGFDPAVTS